MRGYTENVNNIISITERWEEDELWSGTEKSRQDMKKAVGKGKKRTKFQRDFKRGIIRAVEITAIILFIILLGLYAGKINVLGRSNEEVLNQYYREMERDFTNSIQEELKAFGFRNAGITVSSVIEPGISREYSIKIHHGKLAECSSEELDIIMDRLEDITFPDSSCRVKYEILL